MGQKVNPLSLRFPSSIKNYTDCWYSDRYYTQIFLQKLKMNDYFQGILKQKDMPEGQISLMASANSHRYLISFLNPRDSRAYKMSRYRLKTNRQKTTYPLINSSKDTKIKDDRVFQKQFGQILVDNFKQKGVISQQNLLEKRPFCLSLALKNVCLAGLQDSQIVNVLHHYIPNLQKNVFQASTGTRYTKSSGISNSLAKVTSVYQQSPSSISLWSSKWESQHADFLAQEITEALIRRVPFRTIKMQLLKEIEENYKRQWGAVRGLRVTCSGRGGSRSKKAQRAQTLRFHWGQTSLHTFSEKIGFARRSALTSFGKTGVKVWVCYK
jgi:ribosomal protein S3